MGKRPLVLWRPLRDPREGSTLLIPLQEGTRGRQIMQALGEGSRYLRFLPLILLLGGSIWWLPSAFHPWLLPLALLLFVLLLPWRKREEMVPAGEALRFPPSLLPPLEEIFRLLQEEDEGPFVTLLQEQAATLAPETLLKWVEGSVPLLAQGLKPQSLPLSWEIMEARVAALEEALLQEPSSPAEDLPGPQGFQDLEREAREEYERFQALAMAEDLGNLPRGTLLEVLGSMRYYRSFLKHAVVFWPSWGRGEASWGHTLCKKTFTWEEGDSKQGVRGRDKMFTCPLCLKYLETKDEEGPS